jgi:hypothetical protein
MNRPVQLPPIPLHSRPRDAGAAQPATDDCHGSGLEWRRLPAHALKEQAMIPAEALVLAEVLRAVPKEVALLQALRVNPRLRAARVLAAAPQRHAYHRAPTVPHYTVPNYLPVVYSDSPNTALVPFLCMHTRHPLLLQHAWAEPVSKNAFSCRCHRVPQKCRDAEQQFEHGRTVIMRGQ